VNTNLREMFQNGSWLERFSEFRWEILPRKIPLGSLRSKWEDNVKMNLKEMLFEDDSWLERFKNN
jgi:hypothetical protein